MAEKKKTTKKGAAKGTVADRFRNLSDLELRNQEKDLADQLFRLRFQMKLGQTESLKKMRQLRKDVARIRTVSRERALAAGERE